MHTMLSIHRTNDLLRFMRTCRSLYHHGLSILFREKEVVLEDKNLDLEPHSCMISFNQCIMADPTVRGPMVLTLRLHSPSFSDASSEVLSTFTRVLQQLTNLARLYVDEIGAWLNLDMGGGLMVSLQRLRKLKILSITTSKGGIPDGRSMAAL